MQSSDPNNPSSAHGVGGEIHHRAKAGDEFLTTAQGVVIPANQNSLRAGEPGTTLPEEFVLRAQIFHFDHERIGGASCSKNTPHPVTVQLGGAPTPAAVEFPKDTYVHCKHIGWVGNASALLAACGLSAAPDLGVHALSDATSADEFVTACRSLRCWGREDASIS